MSGSGEEDIHREIERLARESYGRLVAYLSSHPRDVASAEDALSDALVAALRSWPRDGPPQNPEAWLLTTARRALIDVIRHQTVVLASEPTLLLLKENSTEATLSTEFPDERLKLLFVCAHPAIDPATHTADAADRSGPGCSAHCSSFLGLAYHDGLTPRSRQDEDPRRRYSVRDSPRA